MIKTACPTTLNLPYGEREIKIEGFGGRPGALGPMGPPLNPALLKGPLYWRERNDWKKKVLFRVKQFRSDGGTSTS